MIPQRMRTWLIVSVVLAVGTTLWAWVPWRSFARGSGGSESAPTTDVLLTATGQPVTPDKVASLRVARWDEQDKAPQVFEVARKGNAWVIPSHFNYPADAGSKVGETAGAVLNLRRGPLVTNKPEQFAELGVIDPLGESAGTASVGTEGAAARGRRVTLKDDGGAVMVDLIVGKPATGLAAPPPAPGAPPQPAGELRYVRPAGGDAVYTAKVDLGEISTAFKDWVETDLLKVNRFDIRHLTIRDYTVDERRGAIQVRSETTFEKPKEPAAAGPLASAGANSNKWVSPQTPTGHAVNQETIDKLLDEVTRLRLTGVRPFDPQWLQQRGFYVAQRGPNQVDLVGNEGSLEIGTTDGLRYRLFFGSVAFGDEEDTLANVTTRPSTSPATTQSTTQPAKGANRYMAVFVQYDPELDRKFDVATPPAPATKPATQPATTQAAAATQPSTQPTVAATTQPTRRAPTEAELAEGRKRAEEKQARFAQFFYVISDENFRKMRPPADQLFEDTAVHKDKLPGEKVSAETELKQTPTGLYYADLKEGTGPEAAEGDKVEVHYTGWLAKDGTQFDTSRKGDNTPLAFTVGKGGVIKGWDEGVKGMKVGGKRKLVIPPDLGYGAAGSPPNIPANARLVFDVELLKVDKPGGAAATTLPATAPTTTAPPATKPAP